MAYLLLNSYFCRILLQLFIDGAHMHLYEQVLDSDGILPETGVIPPLSYFPQEKGFREHVQQCMTIYEQLQQDPARITI